MDRLLARLLPNRRRPVATDLVNNRFGYRDQSVAAVGVQRREAAGCVAEEHCALEGRDKARRGKLCLPSNPPALTGSQVLPSDYPRLRQWAISHG